MIDLNRQELNMGSSQTDESEEEICAKLRHDFMTPIHLITVYTGLLFDTLDDFDPESMREDLTALQEATGQLQQMINALIRMDRIKIIGDPSLRALDQKIQAIPSSPESAETANPSPDFGPSADSISIAQNSVTSARILVADDVAENRELASRLLTPQGYAVVEAENGRQALNLIENGEYDLLLLDVTMPEMDGFALLEELKKRKLLQELPVIMISGRNEMAAATHCIAVGAEAFISKPFQPALLNARVESSLERKRSLDTLREVVEALHEEQNKSNRLLRNILPEKIAHLLKAAPSDQTSLIADKHQEASILFFDLVGFTELAAQIDAGELVGLLNDLFSRFDEMTSFLGLEKIKTIGDSYMVAGGVPEAIPDHANRMAELALAMVEEVQTFEEETGYELHCRVGLHAGTVVAGVIGSQKFTYDLWGKSVNIASRMESYAPTDRVQCSSEFHELIRNHFECSQREKMEIRGVGNVSTFIIEQAIESDSED